VASVLTNSRCANSPASSSRGRKGCRPELGGGGTQLDGCFRAAVPGEAQSGLAFAQKLDVHAGEKQRIHQRAVLDALRVVDAVALAECIEAVGPGRMAAPRQSEGIHHAVEAQGRTGDALQLGVEEGDVEGRVVGDERSSRR